MPLKTPLSFNGIYLRDADGNVVCAMEDSDFPSCQDCANADEIIVAVGRQREPSAPISLLAAWIERAAYTGAMVEPELVTWARANCGETSHLNHRTLEVVARLKEVGSA